MARREDGKKTRQRLLDAACEVFGEKGFRDAKVAEICRRAGSNGAAVNYHFGGKDALYVAAWQRAYDREVPEDPPETPGAPAGERLRLKVETLVKKFCAWGVDGRFLRMYLMELANPTGLIDESWRRAIEPKRRHLMNVVRELAGGEAPEEAVRFCALSIVNQCRALLTLGPAGLEQGMGRPVSPELIRSLTDHITRFSLAGIRTYRQVEGVETS